LNHKKCAKGIWKQGKSDWKNGKITLIVSLLVLLGLAFIILPTGTIEDLVTTLPLIMVIGWKGYMVVVAVLLVVIGVVLALCRKETRKIKACRR